MRKVSEAVQAIIEANPALQFGLHHRLLNLSQVARFICPLVEARVHKSVQPSAVLMSLSRLQRRWENQQPALQRRFRVDRINVQGGLCALTLPKQLATLRELAELFGRVQQEGGYLTLTEGVSEVTVILEQRHMALIPQVLHVIPRRVYRNLAGLGVKFQERYLETPGLLYQLLQQLALQNINVVEVASTTTEFNIYLDDRDVQLAFDSIYNRFVREVS
ncbi:hypothetical protein [Rhodothermus bifroesti]|uniref:Aspartate kinase n=1 Tax=Rhodothermus marinus TaxID=29549 RepID=A0A7V2AZC8_RHOMR|nr:hypothetical protein [Rhodothermus bifroesti]GBD02172.1 hypothetical protein HRbin18_01908 [bacterium HR18]